MYAPDRGQDLRWMQRAIGLATLCLPAAGAYPVGAVIVGEEETKLAAGDSRATAVTFGGDIRMSPPNVTRHLVKSHATLAASVPVDRGGQLANDRVYLIGSPNSPLVKIGWTDNPERRLRHLQTGSPVPLELLAVFEGGPIVEAELHRRFADRRIRGEWFDLGPNPIGVVSPFVKVAQVEEAERTGQRQPKHKLRYDDVTLQECADWFPEDPPRVHERMERECPTYKGAWKCLCDS